MDGQAGKSGGTCAAASGMAITLRSSRQMISSKPSYIWTVMTAAKPATLALAAAILAGCASPPSGQLAIANLKYGTTCGTPYQEVCTQTADIAIDGKGHCVYDHQERSCTWYGFSFDYDPRFDGIVIDCDVVTDFKRDLGNPQGIVQKDTTSHRYQTTLSGGHFVNPQYSTYVPFDGVRHLTERCSYGGQKLFEFMLNLRYVSDVK
jgi:hypothetical protein